MTDLTPERRAELVERVRKEWDRVFTHATESSVDIRQARTAVDALAPELAERDSLVDALQRYGRHEKGCKLLYMNGEEVHSCSCGFQAVLDATGGEQ